MYPTSLYLQLGSLKVHRAFQWSLSVGSMVSREPPFALIHAVLRYQHQGLPWQVIMIEGSLEVKLPTIWREMKGRDGKSQRREEKKKENQNRESLRRKRIQVREKVGKSRNTVFFQLFVAPEGRKVGSLKRRVRSQLAR